MAGCERGYLCTVCGNDVEEITDSVLYLRYVMGEVDWEQLNREAETHIRCHPILAQFIVDSTFEPVSCEGPFAKDQLDSDFVRSEEERVTVAYRRLRELAATGLPIAEYPLPHVIARRDAGSLVTEA
jgi:hypothetical protein